ncbi:uncharacterized protein [Dermacentor andersoni]|uniref:uncharacterized protein n=1 Tax=Dermacentor andersoni TaxID=34620 RepID=UPI003B3B8DCA
MKFSLNPFVLCFLLCLTITYAEEEAGAAAGGSEGESGGGGTEAPKGEETGSTKEGETPSSGSTAAGGGESEGPKPEAPASTGGTEGGGEASAAKKEATPASATGASSPEGQKGKKPRCTAVPDSCTGKTWKWIHDTSNGTCIRRQVGNCAGRSGFHLCPVCVSTCMGNSKNINDICNKKG